MKMRTEYDMEMMARWAFAPASRTTRATSPVGARLAAGTLFDFFPEDFLLVIDDPRHRPAIGGMYAGDCRSNATWSITVSLAAARDNRPLNLEEFADYRAGGVCLGHPRPVRAEPVQRRID